MAPVKTDTFQHYAIYLFNMIAMLGTSWVLATNDHQLIKWWSVAFFVILCGTRFYSFYRKDYLFFLLEMCYTANLASIICIATECDLKLIYPFMHGPLMAYSLVYGDAIILHDLDKTTSYAVHTFGSVVTRRLYWNGDSTQTLSLADMTLSSFFGYFKTSYLLYLGWAIPYAMFYLFPFDGEGITMARYVYRLGPKDILTLEQKIKYITGHMFFVGLTLAVGVFSMYYWQFNYFMVFSQIVSGIINGGWHYYTGKKFNPKKFLSETFFAVKSNVKINKDDMSVSVKLKDDEHVKFTPLQFPQIVKDDINKKTD